MARTNGSSQKEIMRRRMLVSLIMTLQIVFGAVSAALADPPHEAAGIALGASIDDFQKLVEVKTALPVRLMEYLSEVEMKPVPGYRSGYVTFGTCTEQRPVVKVKLKYERDDRAFFDELLKHFEKKFGKAAEYKGDVFGQYIAWKWSFTDKDKTKISLILQHNSADDDEYTSGTSLKLSATGLIDKERKCQEVKTRESKSKSEGQPSKETEPSAVNWDQFLPR